MRSFLIGSVGLIAACSSEQRIDLCRRGDRVELASFQLTALDADGTLLDQWVVSADRETTSDGLLPDGTRRLRAEGLDGAGVTVARGETAISDSSSVCICVSTNTQHEIACRGVACRVADDDRCVFTDEAGTPLGPVTVTFGENMTDDFRDVAVDTYLSAEPSRVTHNFGGDPIVHVGSDPSQPRVGLWQVDLRGVPSTAQILSATFAVTTGDNPTDAPLDFFAVLEDWQAGTGLDDVGCSSWMCRLDGTSWTVPGAGPPTSSGATGLMTIMPAQANTRFEGSSEALRSLVQQWVASPSVNHGITARINSTSNAALDLVSEEGADGNRPTLRIELSIPADPR